MTISNSSGVSFPAFSRISSGTIIFPTSCILDACEIFQLSSSEIPSPRHIISVYSATLFTCVPVCSDCDSIISDNDVRVFSWSAYNSLFFNRTLPTRACILSAMKYAATIKANISRSLGRIPYKITPFKVTSGSSGTTFNAKAARCDTTSIGTVSTDT